MYIRPWQPLTPPERNTEPLPMVGNDTKAQLPLTAAQEAVSRLTNM